MKRATDNMMRELARVQKAGGIVYTYARNATMRALERRRWVEWASIPGGAGWQITIAGTDELRRWWDS